MAVDFIQPVTGGPFGPGFAIALDSDFVGPLSSGSFWQLNIAPAADPEEYVEIESFATASNAAAWVFAAQAFETVPLTFASKERYDGAPMTLTAVLHDGSTPVDSGTLNVTWDTRSGIPYILQQLLAKQTVGQVDAAGQLEEIDRVVHADFGPLGRFGLSDLLPIPSPGLTQRLLITPDRSGDGQLDRPLLGLDVFALGLEWEWVTIPPGNGSRDGAPDRQERPVLDLMQVGTDNAASEYIRAYDRFDVEHLRWTFNPIGLTRIQYRIEPGSVVRFYWLVLG